MASLNINAIKDSRKISLIRRTKIEAAKSSKDRITSPLAKYDQQGNLHCIICKTIVKSASIWKVHINTANHKRNVEITRQLKDDLLKAKPLAIEQTTQKHKEVILQKTLDVEVKEEVKPSVSAAEITQNVQIQDALPENFFDVSKDSEKEKEALDEEWQRFQKEIKEEEVVSHVIEASDQDNVAYDRQLEEIDEQMLCWTKVRTLEEKKEKTIQKKNKKTPLEEIESDSDESVTVEDFPDWRCKKYKR